MTRVAVFIDYQNAYRGIRSAMGWDDEPFTVGQVYPRRLGIVLCDRGRPVDPKRALEYVKVYRGQPSSKYDAKGQSACQRQVRFWRAQASVTPVTRPLKYYPTTWDHLGFPVAWEAREKGIDVLLAIHMVMGARNNEYDVAVLVSADTDLIPALEAVRDLGKVVEVAAWDGPLRNSRLSLRPNVWCHWLNESDYRLVGDPTDYTVPQPSHARTAPKDTP